MLDRMGGMQLRLWTIKPKFEKKITLEHGRTAISLFGTTGYEATIEISLWNGLTDKCTDQVVHSKAGVKEKSPLHCRTITVEDKVPRLLSIGLSH